MRPKHDPRHAGRDSLSSSRGDRTRAQDFPEFLRRSTAIGPADLCPELRLHAARDLQALWRAQEDWQGRLGLAAPYWGVPWPGGQALARYILDHPSQLRGRSVLDFGSGSGICAIAAAKAGARRVEAADIDPYSLEAIAANARLNDVHVELVGEDLLGAPSRWDVVLAGDVWYEKFLAIRLASWLRSPALGATSKLLGDLGRAYFPRTGVVELARYPFPAAAPHERGTAGTVGVWSAMPR